MSFFTNSTDNLGLTTGGVVQYTLANGQFTAGAISVINGGTGSASFNPNAVIISGATSTSPLLSTTTMTNGQVVIGSTGASPVANTLTAGSGITITNGAGSITIAATASGTGITWQTINSTTSPTVAMAINNGYSVIGGSGTATFTLPTPAPAIGTVVNVCGRDTGSNWILTNAGVYSIVMGNKSTTQLASTGGASSLGDGVELVYLLTNTWVVLYTMGNIQVT